MYSDLFTHLRVCQIGVVHFLTGDIQTNELTSRFLRVEFVLNA